MPTPPNNFDISDWVRQLIPPVLDGNNPNNIRSSDVTVPAGVLFYDDFDYVAPRTGKISQTNNAFVTTGGWNDIKDEDTYPAGDPHGWLYTTDSIDGYSGELPGRGDRVLRVEMLPTIEQTDTFLTLFDGLTPGEVPADVWFQFWIYPIDTVTYPSTYFARNKFLYPCAGTYPCNDLRWLYQLGSETTNPYCGGEEPTGDGLYSRLQDGLGTFTGADVLCDSSANDSKMGQTNTDGAGDYTKKIEPNQWTLVKLHIDTSSLAGVYEEWMRDLNGSWIKTSDWQSGVTPAGFAWDPVDYGGHSVLKLFTTFPGSNTPVYEDSHFAMGDFAMAGTEANLPTYPY